MTTAFSESYQAKLTLTVQGRYLVYLPTDYHQKKKNFPLMLFLHGSGERGDHLELVKRHGPPYLAEHGWEFPFILIAPQCPENEWWSVPVLKAVLDDVVAKFRVQSKRVYLTGLSMGGFGTWALAMAHPERFAAISPICGGGDPGKVSAIKNIPTWVFHGNRDRAVPLRRSKEMVEALQQCGGDVRFTVYQDVGHDCWTQTYSNPELYDWFLSHKK